LASAVFGSDRFDTLYDHFLVFGTKGAHRTQHGDRFGDDVTPVAAIYGTNGHHSRVIGNMQVAAHDSLQNC